MPSLSLLSPHAVFVAGEAVRFSCTVLLGHHLSDFHLYKQGVSTPLVTQRVDQSQTRVELTLTDLETFHQGSYSCVYRIRGSSPSQLLASPPSNSINITVGKSCWLVCVPIPPPHPFESLFKSERIRALLDVQKEMSSVYINLFTVR